jgi:hypothetical protein
MSPLATQASQQQVAESIGQILESREQGAENSSWPPKNNFQVGLFIRRMSSQASQASQQQRAESGEQRAESSSWPRENSQASQAFQQQRAESKEQRAQSREQRAAPGFQKTISKQGF